MIGARLATMRQGERTDLSSNEEKLSIKDSAGLLNIGNCNLAKIDIGSDWNDKGLAEWAELD